MNRIIPAKIYVALSLHDRPMCYNIEYGNKQKTGAFIAAKNRASARLPYRRENRFRGLPKLGRFGKDV